MKDKPQVESLNIGSDSFLLKTFKGCRQKVEESARLVSRAGDRLEKRFVLPVINDDEGNPIAISIGSGMGGRAPYKLH